MATVRSRTRNAASVYKSALPGRGCRSRSARSRYGRGFAMAAARLGSRRRRFVDGPRTSKALRAGLSGSAHPAGHRAFGCSTRTSSLVVVAPTGCARRFVGRCDVGRQVDRTGPPRRIGPHQPSTTAHADSAYRWPRDRRDPTRRRHARDVSRAHSVRYRQAPRTRRGRPACRRAHECDRREGQRYRVGRTTASWRPRSDATPSDT